MATDPVCGMAVEPGPGALQLTRENRTYYFCSSACLRSFADPEEERARLGRRLAIAWPLAIAVAAFTYAVPTRTGAAAAGILAAVVELYCGWPFFVGARDAVRQRTGNMDLLIAIATSAAFVYSAVAWALPDRLPHAYYFDASALIIALLLSGNYLEALTRSSTGTAVRRLGELLPTEVMLVDAAGERKVRLDDVTVGSRVRVPPGGRIPIDGIVRSGRSTVDESILTGEPLPAARGPGDRLLAGSMNLEGALEVEAIGIGADTFVAQVAALLTDAEQSRVPLRRLADRMAGVFVPVVLTVAVVAGLGWGFLGHAGVTVAVLVFVTVAITACPCAFGIATPAAIVVGTGRAAEAGVLFRGEDAIEQSARVDLVVMDKTGTLTRGAPVVAGVVAVPPLDDPGFLSLAAGVETGIDHPFAVAVVAEAHRRAITPLSFDSSRIEPGRGVVGRVGEREVSVVRGESARSEGIDLSAIREWIGPVEQKGESWSILLEGARVAGAISFRSELAPHAREGVAALKRAGIRVAIATGDSWAAGEAVAREVGSDELRAGLDPAGKVALLKAYRADGHRVAFVGDGVNDAPALAAADVGIAIGTGADVAKDAGQVLIVRPDFLAVPAALGLARATVERVRWNLMWAIGYNVVLLPIAAGALVPLFGFSIYNILPILGAVAMALSSTTVVLNSLWLRRAPIDIVAAPPLARPSVSRSTG